MAALLEVKALHYYYGNIHVVKGIDMTEEEGEMVTMIGANGAGKTTTLQTISGLTPASGVRGEIYFDGKNIAKMGGDKIAAMGLSQVIEGRHIFSKLTVKENLLMGTYCRKSRAGLEDEVKRIYKLFPRLEERKNQLGGTLSGGEQQMLAIARSLISNPRMILLDEPSLGLAPIIIHEIFEAIKEINYQEGKTILFVEQNARIALKTASRGYVFQNGEIIVEDTSENLESNPQIQKAYLGG